jgi:hypothetical protein
MSGESNLEVLLKSMKPELQAGVFVFCTLPDGQEISSAINPVSCFREKEGVAFIIKREEAENAGLSYQFPSRQITLTIHSSLEAIGFLAAITDCLAQAGISVNPLSAFYHDHLFVPVDRADEAMNLLHDLANKPANDMRPAKIQGSADFGMDI